MHGAERMWCNGQWCLNAIDESVRNDRVELRGVGRLEVRDGFSRSIVARDDSLVVGAVADTLAEEI